MSLRIKKVWCAVLFAVLLACVSGFFVSAFNTAVEAETVTSEGFYTEDGASVRYNSDTPGIRFTSYITEEHYNGLKNKAADGALTFYTIIEKADDASASKVKIAHEQTVEFDENGLAVFNAALVFKKASGALTAEEIKAASAMELKAATYVQYTDKDGQTVTEQAANDGVVRSMRGVANYAIRVGVTAEQEAFLNAYLGTTTTDDTARKIVLTDKSAVELFGVTEGAVYIGAKKVGDIAGGKIDLSSATVPTGSATEVYVFDSDNNCTIYTCTFIQPVDLAENYVVGLNRTSATYTYTMNDEEVVTSVTINGTELASSDYTQSGNVVTLNASAFTAVGDAVVVIETATAVYNDTAEVFDMAIGTLDEFKAFWCRDTFPSGGTITLKVAFTADIDASSYDFNGGTVLTNFTFDGLIDGKGHTISGANSSYYGFMQTLGENGVIKNVAFTGIRFYRTSAIFNDRIKGRLENCYFEGTGGTATDNNALCKWVNNTAVFKNVVVYLHDRPSGTETQVALFRESMTLPTAPSGLYVINTSSAGEICTAVGNTDMSDVHLYTSLADFAADVTELPAGFTREYWHIGENGLTFGKVLDRVELTEKPFVALNRANETCTLTLNDEEAITSFKVGGTELASSDYTQSGKVVSFDLSLFTISGDISIEIATATTIYTGTAEVFDMAIGTLDEFKTFWCRDTLPASQTVTLKVAFTADIDASSYTFNGGTVLTNFTFNGVIDGRGHTVKGVCSTYFGLFYGIGADAVIKNIAFTDINFYRVSTIVNYKLEGTLDNCYFEGSGGSTADNNALAKQLGANAVLNNVVLYLHDRPSGTETQNGVFVGLTSGTSAVATAPKGVYVINTSSNGVICNAAGSTDISDIHLYSSIEDFAADVTTLPAGFSSDYWHIGENGLAFGKTITKDLVSLSEKPLVGLNRSGETYSFTLNGEEVVTSVKVGGAQLTSSDYTQSGNVITLNASAFTAVGDISIEIETATTIYTGTAEVFDMAIGTLDEFKAFWSVSNLASKTVTSRVALTANIDATGYDNGGNITACNFAGVLDGRGYTISNARASWNGLLYNLTADGVIKNVAFTGIRFVNDSIVIANKLEGTIENCYFESHTVEKTTAGATTLLANQIGANAVLKNIVIYADNRPANCSAQNGVFNRVIDAATMATAPSGVYVVNTNSNGNICNTASIGSTDISGIRLYSTLGEFINDVKELPEGFSSDIWQIDENGGLVFASSPEGLPTFGLHKASVTDNADRTFVYNKKSEYVIIADNNGDAMTKAVKLITDNVYKATGVTLTKEVYATGRESDWTANDKLIIFDNAEFFAKAGLTMPNEDLGNCGYYVKTVGNTVFIMCGGEDGYQLGAIRFLSETLGYDRLSEDCTVYDKSGATIPDMEIIEKPDFEYRMASNFKMPNAVYGMGFNKANFNAMFMAVPDRATGDNALTMHNSYNYLPPSMYQSAHPKWYSNAGNTVKQQLCYTAHGDSTEYQAMVDTLYEYLKQIVDANPDMSNITITHQDNLYYCDCSSCASVISTYGAISAAYIMFLNDVDDKLQADLEAEALANGTEKREVNIVFFAYHGTKESPTKLVNGKYQPTSENVVMNEHVGVIVAPIESYYTSSLYSDKNKEYGESEAVKSWSCLTNKVYMWIYETYFNNYFYPYNTWETILPNYIFCYENNAVYMFDQGQHNQASPTAFMAFKYYLDSKAGINVNYSYAELEEKFFNGYFKDAAGSMKNYFNALKAQLKYLEETYSSVDGGINNGMDNVLANASYWSVDTLNEYLGYINAALSDIAAYAEADSATYAMLKNHIVAESLFPRYALLTLHEDSFTSEELAEMRASFKEDCEALGLTQEAESASKTLSALFTSWGL